MTRLYYALILVLLYYSCKKEYKETLVDFSNYHLAEPLLEAPVTISFDDQGQLWGFRAYWIHAYRRRHK
ncbi:hypothetical protein [Flavobacterium sp. ASW18X]|uniref:hypothetical protein n=1 Tax=Flavobacterium sp. ASW18X TaxID=2572595 RepID=UPI0010AE50FE|nr:hypothetical protein [Flavobacterium sp. ASW18X]TKD59195.1 hypothetical protein FBT53_13750 [Flavobacterium sp. ASW18X]